MLCGLLLGFGLDAYVVLGTIGSSSSHGEEELDHVWVLTRNGAGGAVAAFWDPATGEHIDVAAAAASRDPRLGKRYLTLNCVFNHREFYANIQMDDRLGHTSLTLDDPKSWKPMDRQQLQLVLPWNVAVSFRSPSIDPAQMEHEIESAVRGKIAEYRSKKSEPQFDSAFSHVLAPALYSYETERLFGRAVGADFFQDAVTSALPRGFVFKAVPVQLCGTEAAKAFDAILAAPVSVIGITGG